MANSKKYPRMVTIYGLFKPLKLKYYTPKKQSRNLLKPEQLSNFSLQLSGFSIYAVLIDNQQPFTEPKPEHAVVCHLLSSHNQVFGAGKSLSTQKLVAFGSNHAMHFQTERRIDDCVQSVTVSLLHLSHGLFQYIFETQIGLESNAIALICLTTTSTINLNQKFLTKDVRKSAEDLMKSLKDQEDCMMVDKKDFSVRLRLKVCGIEMLPMFDCHQNFPGTKITTHGASRPLSRSRCSK